MLFCESHLAHRQGSLMYFPVVLFRRLIGLVPSIDVSNPMNARYSGRVLVVEDNPVNQAIVTAMLKRLGVAYDVSGNGRQALSALEHREYHLILMDCNLPVLDGYETTMRLRERESLSDRQRRTPP